MVLLYDKCVGAGAGIKQLLHDNIEVLYQRTIVLHINFLMKIFKILYYVVVLIAQGRSPRAINMTEGLNARFPRSFVSVRY